MRLRDGVAMTPVEATMRSGGAARTVQLLAHGCTPYSIRKAVEDGALVRVSRGAYVLPDAEPATLLAMRLGAGITCLTALAHYGLPIPTRPAETHLAVPRNFTQGAGQNACGARLHYMASRPVAGAVASVADALDCAGACLSEEWHLAAVDAALHEGLITMADVMRFKRTTVARRTFLLTYADPRAEAPGESIVRLRLARAGLSVTPQAYVEGAGHVDLEVEGLLILQVDGFEPHSGRKAFVRDRAKSRAVIKAGRPQLTYAASELLGYYSADVVGEVRDALDQWRARDLAAVRPSGRRILHIQRDEVSNLPRGT